MTKDDKKKPGPEPERLKIDATMEEVAKRMLTTATGEASWDELLEEGGERREGSDDEKEREDD